MNKVLLLTMCILITGCSSIRPVGDLEMLNGTKLESVRELIKTYDKTANTVGDYQEGQTVNTGKANRGYYHINNFQHTSIPTTVQDLKDIERYLAR